MIQPQLRPKTQRAGFTLIEMLAVMVILSILMAFLVTALMGGARTVEIEETRQFLAQVEASVGMFESESGDYPASTFPPAADRGSNKTNMGIEELVVTLMAPGSQAIELPEDRLVNTDEDSSRKSVTRFPRPDLFELSDYWGNPIAYFHRRDYGASPQLYITFDGETGEMLEELVSARKNEKTGTFYNRTSVQLISAGPDGRFGTDDDIGNWETMISQ